MVLTDRSWSSYVSSCTLHSSSNIMLHIKPWNRFQAHFMTGGNSKWSVRSKVGECYGRCRYSCTILWSILQYCNPFYLDTLCTSTEITFLLSLNWAFVKFNSKLFIWKEKWVWKKSAVMPIFSKVNIQYNIIKSLYQAFDLIWTLLKQ